jgi:hypothetical protein
MGGIGYGLCPLLCFCIGRVTVSRPATFFPPMARQPLGVLGRLIFRGFTITHFRHTTLGRTPLKEGPARRRDLYLTTHNTLKRQTFMPPVGFFCACPGFFPFDPFLYCIKSFRPLCHFTFHISPYTTNTTQTSMPLAGFEPTIPVSERPQTHALDRTATGIGLVQLLVLVNLQVTLKCEAFSN